SPEQTKRDVLLEIMGHILNHTLDLNLVLSGKFMAEITNGCCKPQVVQLGWMQLMRHVLDVSRDFIGQPPNLPQFLLLQPICIRGCSLVTLLNSVCQQRQPLVDVVVQLARNASTFRFFCLDKSAAEVD